MGDSSEHPKSEKATTAQPRCSAIDGAPARRPGSTCGKGSPPASRSCRLRGRARRLRWLLAPGERLRSRPPRPLRRRSTPAPAQAQRRCDSSRHPGRHDTGPVEIMLLAVVEVAPGRRYWFCVAPSASWPRPSEPDRGRRRAADRQADEARTSGRGQGAATSNYARSQFGKDVTPDDDVRSLMV